MYKSPIHVDYLTSISEEISEGVDKKILAKVRAIIDVDKEELIKAIAYDRNQYEKGYKEGFKEALEKITIENRAKGKWAETGRIFNFHECSNCGEEAFSDDCGEYLSNFCPNCGADMRGEE